MHRIEVDRSRSTSYVASPTWILPAPFPARLALPISSYAVRGGDVSRGAAAGAGEPRPLTPMATNVSTAIVVSMQ